MHRLALAVAALAVAAGTMGWAADDARLQSLQTELVLDTPGRVAACDVITFTPDGKHLLAAGDDKLVRSWQWTGQKLVQEEPYRWSIYREQRGSIYCLGLSPDAKRIAIGGFGLREGSAAIFDAETHGVAHGITRQALLGRQQSTIWAIAFSDRGDRIAYGGDDGSIWLWEPAQTEARKMLRRLGQHPPVRQSTNKIKHIRFRDESNVISVAEDGWVLQWDTRRDSADPTQLFRFDVATNLVGVAFDKKHQRLAGVGQRKNARAVEIRGLDGGKVHVLETPDERSFGNCVAFDPSGDRLAVGTYSTPAGGKFYKITHGGITIFDLSGEPKAIPGPPTTWYPEALAFHPTENLLAVAGGNDHEVAVFDLAKPLTPLAEEKGPGMCLWGVGLVNAEVRDPDGPRTRTALLLGVQAQRAVDPEHPNRRGTGPWQVFDLTARRWATEADAPAFRPEPELFTVDGWKLAPDPQDGTIWYVFSPDGKQHRIPLSADDFMPRCYTFLKATAGKQPRLAVGHYWGLSIFALDAERGPLLVRKCIGHQGEVMAIGRSPDDSILVTASRDQTVCAWSLADWPGQAELGATFRAAGDRVAIDKVEAGSPAWEARLQAGDEFTMFAYGGKPVHGGPAAWLDTLRGLQPGKQCYFGNVIRGGQPAGDRLTTVRQRPIWRFFPMARREWVLWRHQDYYYDTSTNGDFRIGWQLSRDVDETPTYYKTEQFRVRFHQAEKVIDALAGIRRSEDESIARIEPPRVTLSVKKKPGDDAGLALTLSAVARGEDDMQKLQKVIVWVNEHVVHEETFALPTTAADRTIDVAPRSIRTGENRITVQAYNRLELRDQAAEMVQYDRPKRPPMLHGLLIGVSDYSKAYPKMAKLSGAEDAEGLATIWRGQEGKQFRRASLQVLTNENATHDRILRAFDYLRRAVQPDDTLLLFFAGHGTGSEQILGDKRWGNEIKSLGWQDYQSQGIKNGMFFFVPSDFDIRRPLSTGVSSDSISAEMRSLPCHKIVLLDACHSGSLRNSDPLRKLAPAGVGPVMIAACEPHQSAIEAPDAHAGIWVEGQAKGLFAISLLQGLSERYNFQADRDRDGLVNASELVEYTRTEVPRLLNKLLFERKELGVEQFPSAFLPDLERLLPIARRAPTEANKQP